MSASRAAASPCLQRRRRRVTSPGGSGVWLDIDGRNRRVEYPAVTEFSRPLRNRGRGRLPMKRPALSSLVLVACAAPGARAQPVGSELRANTYLTGQQQRPAVSCDAAGAFVVVWMTFGEGGDPSYSIAGQRYSSAGAPLGTQFRVNTYTPFDQRYPAVAFAAGSFVVAWQYTAYSADEVYARRYA